MEAKAQAAVSSWNFSKHISYSGQCSCNGTKNNPLTYFYDWWNICSATFNASVQIMDFKCKIFASERFLLKWRKGQQCIIEWHQSKMTKTLKENWTFNSLWLVRGCAQISFLCYVLAISSREGTQQVCVQPTRIGFHVGEEGGTPVH